MFRVKLILFFGVAVTSNVVLAGGSNNSVPAKSVPVAVSECYKKADIYYDLINNCLINAEQGQGHTCYSKPSYIVFYRQHLVSCLIETRNNKEPRWDKLTLCSQAIAVARELCARKTSWNPGFLGVNRINCERRFLYSIEKDSPKWWERYDSDSGKSFLEEPKACINTM
ncbi:MAG: hypothetical protein JG718_04380 [Candidatus Thiothrix moscowensis]|nr:hypothetical protein [Candidatus Thiothrix moscowensis]